LADHFGAGRVEELAGLKVAYVGDANNVTRSLAGALVRLGVVVTIAAPESRQLTATDLAQLRAVARGGGSVTLLEDPREAAAGANALYTDVWVSMGDESDAAQRRRELSGYQINESLLAHAAPGAVVLHCLPAHRGEEITDGVLESPQSLVWQQVRHRTSSMVGVLRWMKENHP
jgi:ornithine carbamoyltransferase